MNKLTVLIFALFSSVSAANAEIAPPANPDTVKTSVQTVAGLRANPASKKPDSLVVTLQVDSVLKSRDAASLRVAANLEAENQLTTVYMRSLKRGKDTFEIRVTAKSFQRDRLGLVIWLDQNPREEKSPVKPLAFEKIALDVSKY